MKNLFLFSVVTLLAGQYHLSAQPFNFGNQNTSTSRATPIKDKETFTEEAEIRRLHLQKNLSTRSRLKDPFGSDMDPSLAEKIQPVPETQAKVIAEPVVILPKKIPLQKVLSKFTPNLISASKQLVMVGSHILEVGDPVSIQYGDTIFKLRIIRIGVNEVEFINPLTQEKAVVQEYEYQPNQSSDEAVDPFKENLDKENAPFLIK